MVELQINNKSFRNGKQFAWDATSITLAETCLRKYKYKMIDGWQPKDLSVHLRFGQHYATALEHYYKHLFNGMAPEEALRRVIREALEATWDRTEDNPEGAAWQGDTVKSYKNRGTLIRTIIWYIDHFAADPLDIVVLANGAPALEYSFALPVDNGVVFCGHIDRMVNYANEPYVMDQKTTKSAISSYYFEQFKPNTQFSMYTFSAKALFSIPVHGVIVDAVQIAEGFSRYARGFSHRGPAELDEWYDDTMYYIQLAQQAALNNYFPMNPAACGNYGGCEFRPVCSKSPDVRSRFMAADFIQGPAWDPIERR